MDPRRAAIVTEARSWLRTPYHHQGDIRGVGVDCAMLLVRVYTACGLIPADTDPRPYPTDWHLHRSSERYLGWLKKFGTEISPSTAKPGDVLVWRFGRTYSHGAILIDAGGDMVHAYLGIGCVLGRRDEDRFRKRRCRAFTLLPGVD